MNGMLYILLSFKIYNHQIVFNFAFTDEKNEVQRILFKLTRHLS